MRSYSPKRSLLTTGEVSHVLIFTHDLNAVSCNAFMQNKTKQNNICHSCPSHILELPLQSIQNAKCPPPHPAPPSPLFTSTLHTSLLPPTHPLPFPSILWSAATVAAVTRCRHVYLSSLIYWPEVCLLTKVRD